MGKQKSTKQTKNANNTGKTGKGDKTDKLTEMITAIVEKVIQTLDEKKCLKKNTKTAFQKTEQMLYNYCKFKKLLVQRQEQLQLIKTTGNTTGKTTGNTTGNENGHNNVVDTVHNTVHNTVGTVHTVPTVHTQATVQRLCGEITTLVDTINLIDLAMKSLENDPYYKILPMRYFDNYTMEDIAIELKCDSATVCRNKTRLVKALALEMFPADAINVL